MSVLGKRLKTAREDAGLSQSDLARAVGVTPQAIQAIEAGRVKRTKMLYELAAQVGKTPDWLMGGKALLLGNRLPTANVAVRGLVAAGLWQEDSSQIGDDTLVPSSPDPRFAHFPQVAYRVVGNSMNRIVGDGEYVICVDYDAAPMSLRDGDIVVAERHRAGTYERTVKRVRIGRNGKPELWPESDDPAHQTAISMGSKETDAEVRIVGLVVGYYRVA